MTDIQQTGGDATPEELAEWDRQHKEWWSVIREKVAAGYLWDEDRLTLTHAKDAERFIMFDPMTLEAIYSAKLIALIDHEIERAKRSGES